MTDGVWTTVDKLIHDLGAIRAFVDEAEAVPEASGTREVVEVRGAMNAATDAITVLFTDTEAAALEAAWTAIARAQDAVAKARERIAQARAGQQNADGMREANRAQLARALAQAQVVADQRDRMRRRRSSSHPHDDREPSGTR
jgi:hypothetical protein